MSRLADRFENVASTALLKSADADGSVGTLESCVSAGSPSKLSELLVKIPVLYSQLVTTKIY